MAEKSGKGSISNLSTKVLVASRQLVEENVGYVRIIVTDRAMEYFMDRPVRAALPAVADAFFHISTDFMAARADLWRYAVLYLHGGAYLDMDGAVKLAKLVK